MADDVVEWGIGSLKVSLRGPSTIYMTVMAVALTSTIYILWVDVRENRLEAYSEHLLIQNGIDELVYIETLTIEERRALNLNMPNSLAKKRGINNHEQR